MYGDSLGLDAWESIQHLDTLPDDIAEQVAVSTARNKLIVDTYLAYAPVLLIYMTVTDSINSSLILI